ncbi:MAG: hypothetical protein K6E19_01190, partial [Lachnospiraceae bacterium]|nr:hypothetical protein [Lachnospiraceae bacterium]
NAVSIVDPDRIVVTGYMFEVPGLLERVRKTYALYDPAKGEDFIEQSALPERKNHTEALSSVLEEHFF